MESQLYEGTLDHATRMVLESIVRLEQKIDRLCSLLFSGEFHKYKYTGEVVNISGGGLRLVSPVNLSKGSYIDMCIFFPPAYNNPFFVIGEVRKRKAIIKENDTNRSKYLLGVKFVAIDEKDREAIIRYIFRTERQKLREARLECDG
ncbi:MAG TPA: PilZ domain-containing protein [Deltaproteobacteria bacterium]|nr:PilZ domain-containing protein [Deltaproteobacteria bacterium]